MFLTFHTAFVRADESLSISVHLIVQCACVLVVFCLCCRFCDDCAWYLGRLSDRRQEAGVVCGTRQEQKRVLYVLLHRVLHRPLCARHSIEVHFGCVFGWKQDAKERQFVVSGRVKSSPPFAFTGGMNFVQNKEQMKQITGWREVGTGGLYGEWSQRGVVGGTFSMQPTIPKEQRESPIPFLSCDQHSHTLCLYPIQRLWKNGWCTLRRKTVEGCCARWVVTRTRLTTS